MLTKEKENLFRIAGTKIDSAKYAAAFSAKRVATGELVSSYIRRVMSEAADHLITVAKARHEAEYNAGYADGAAAEAAAKLEAIKDELSEYLNESEGSK